MIGNDTEGIVVFLDDVRHANGGGDSLEIAAGRNKYRSSITTRNYRNSNVSLFEKALQKWMVDPLGRWGARSWMEGMQCTVQEQ